MDKKELQQRLNQPYTTENWQEIVKFVFPNASLKSKPLVLSVLPKYKDIVETFNILGEVPLEGQKTLILLELKLKDKVNIIKNRVQLNEIVSSVIDTESANGVLSIFEKGTDDYRFSFVARSNEFSEDGDLVEKKTDAKRFTYVLGKNESCKTPANQFYELRKHKDNLIIDDVIKAFNITKLNGEFFDEYKAIYNNIVEFFTGKKLVKVGGKWEEKTTSKPDAQLTYIFKNNELEARNFVKMLLGRIVFLKFVQKKGWMGVPKTRTDWKEGNIRFLEETFENFKHKELFYSTFLSPLFFDALNNPNRKDDVFKLTDSKIPYLSGGLFDEDNLKTKEIIIPEKHFEDIFEFLDKYNFTIDENSDIDDKNEFSVDPEMLGHIFENLLEDNKEKGAFYTPKEIVRYMCQESLKEYLKTSIENNNQWPTDETEAKDLEQGLQNFVTKKEAKGITEFDVTIARALKEVKICDPAIGSGAFPMGLLNEIFQLVHKLYEYNEDKVERVWGLSGWQPNLVKQNIIQNSIYGVDIEKGAVDVARLRFWLSLIVDEPEPKALPHLDYKIVVGNSLVSKLDDTIIDIDWNLDETQHGLFGAELAKERATILQNISDKQKAVFDPNSDEEKLSLEIRNLKIDLLCKQLELMITNQNIPAEPKAIDYQNKPKAKFIQDQAKYFETIGWKKQIEKLQKLRKNPNGVLHFFDWKLDFPEIMNEQVTDKVGFDIVIGNPPYVNVEKIDKSIKDSISKFKTAYQKYDLYVLFYELSLNILSQKGILSFITSNKFLSQGYGLKLRQLFLENTIQEIVNFNYDIFDSATVRTCIIQIKKEKITDNEIKIIDVNQLADKHKFINKNYSYLLQNIFNETDENNFRINLTNEKIDILNKVKKDTFRIDDICSVNYGLRPSSEKLGLKKEAFIFESNNENKYKPYFEGKDMGYWLVKNSSYIDYRPDVMYNSMFPELFENKKLVGLRTLSDIEKLRFIYDDKNLYCNDSVVVLTLWHNFKNVDNITINRNISKEKIINSISYEYYFIQGILNSNLTKFFVNELLYDGTHFYPNHMKQLPIKKAKKNIQEKIKKKVESIYNNIENNIDTTELEQQIDNLVYKLYKLTYDEVLVVEPEFSERMSKVDYESLKVE